MFEIGDMLVYGNNGVCIVEDVGSVDLPCIPNDAVYYTLRQYDEKGGKIYTPVDNDKVVIRPVISKEEALELIDDIGSLESLWVADEKKRELIYKEAFKKSDCREMARIIKTIYMNSQARIAEGKKVKASDERYFKMAEERFYGELSIPLEMEKEEVRGLIISMVGEQ